MLLQLIILQKEVKQKEASQYNKEMKERCKNGNVFVK